MPEHLTRHDVIKRTVRIRITGKGDIATLVAAQIVDHVDEINKKIIDWSGLVPAESDSAVNHVYLTLSNKEE